jgi:hypothetical protein
MRTLLVFLFLISFTGCQKTIPADCVERTQQDGRLCPFVYAPVCGCNGKTYGNECVAQSVGITRYTPGECSK